MSHAQFNAVLHLISLSRYDEAERRLRQLLLSDPQNALAHSLLSRCLLEQKKYPEATEEAQAAVALEPDDAGTHFSLARVWHERRYADRAEQSIDEAIRLAPHDADYHAYKAVLEFEKSRWREALAAAETALRCDPEHVAANNFRAMALVKLGRRGEAGQTIDAALARAPEDAFSHANKGWALLEARKPKEAMNHFREALRLEPNLEYARLGIVEALKAGNPIYGLFLRYTLAMAKLPPKWQIGVILGAWFGNRLLNDFAEANPAARPWVLPISAAYIVFVIFTWLARPIFNLLLLVHPLGRHALSAKEKYESYLIGGCLAGAAVCFGVSLWEEYEHFGLPALWLGLLTMPIYLAFQASPGWPRYALMGAVAVLVVSAVGSFAFIYLGDVGSFRWLAGLYWNVWIATIWGGQLVAAARPRL